MPLPSAALLARWAIQFAPDVIPAARRLYATGRWRQLAVMHARTVLDGTFSDEFIDGERVWVVWSGDDPQAAYPDQPSTDLGIALERSRPERRRDPEDLSLPRARRSLRRLTRRDSDGSAAAGQPAAEPDDDATRG